MKIKIKNKIIEILDKELLITKNVNTYKIDIEIDDDFKKCTNLYVVYKNENVIKKEIIGPDFKSTIPHEVLDKTGTLYMGFFGTYLDGDVLKERHVTNLDKLTIVEGSYYEEATNTEEIDATILEKYLAQMNLIYKTYLEELNKISTDVSNMKVAVETSEQNAKTSENNAKASEIAAQNSANEASASESNIIAIEKNIKSIQEDVQVNKEATDKNVETTNSNVEKANTQAIKAENQAKISTENAAATSADKNAVSEMKSEVEEFKIEAKNCRDEAESFKNETLEAKEVVEKSLEKERIKSEKEYAKAVDTEVITVEEFAQVELDEDGYMEDVSIEAAKEITQEVREGHNIVDFSSKGGFENDVLTVSGSDSWGSSYFNITEIFKNNPNKNLYFSCESFDFSNSNNGNVMLLTYNEDGTRGYNALLNNAGVFKPAPIPADTSTITKAEIGVYYNNTETNGTTYTTTITKPMLAFEQNLPYEAYGVSPSLNYPSDFQNMVKEVDFSNSRKNILDVSLLRDTFEFYGVTFNKTEYGYLLNGKVTSEAAGYLFGESLQGTQENWELSKGTYTFQTSNNKLVFSLVYGGNTILPLGTKNFSEEQKIHGLRFQFSKDTVFNDEKLILQVAKEDKPSEIEPYQGNTNKLALPEGKFIGNFKGYSNAIDKGILKGQLKEVVLTGDEVIDINTNFSFGNIFYYEPDNCFSTTSRENSNIICNYLKGVTYNQLTSGIEGVTYNKDNNGKIIFFIEELKTATVEQFKSKLKELYNAGNPVKILYVAQTEEKQELSQENLQVVNSLQTYQGENNISTPKAKLSFKANQGLSSYVDKVVDDKLVENNISEREISDSKYARALKTKVAETDFVQIVAENEKIDGLQIYGEELTQETREGYNELDIKTLNYVMNITIVEQTSKTITVEMADMNTKSNFRLNPVELKAGVIYKIQRDYEVLTGTKQNDTGALEIFFGTTWKKVILGSSQKQGTFTVDEDGTYYILFKIAETNVSNFIEKIKIKFSNIMLYDYTSQTNKPYEQYGAMPSLDYPSEVQVANKQEIQVANENLISDTDNLYKTANGGNIQISVNEEGVIILNGTPTANYVSLTTGKNITDFLKDGETYTLYKTNSNEVYNQITASKRDGSGNEYYANFNDKKVFTVDKSKYKSYNYNIQLGAIANSVTFDNYECNFMLLHGDYTNKEVTYIPHEGSSSQIVLPQDTFTGAIGSYKDTIKEVDGRWKVVKRIFKHIVNGNENMYICTPDNANFDEYAMNLAGNSLPNGLNSHNAISNYFSDKDNNRIVVAGSNSVEYIRVPLEYGLDTLEKFKAKLTELYNAGTPVEIYYVLATPEYIDLPDESQEILNGIELRLGLNNFSIDVGTFSYIYNKSLEKELEEKDALIEELASRILALENATLNLAEGE